MAVGGTRVVGSGMRVGRPAGGSSWPPRPHHPGAARPARRVVVGDLGYDVSFTRPKSYSLLLAFRQRGYCRRRGGRLHRGGGRTFGWLERQCSDGMRGHHGDGQSAATVAGSGFLGWSMVHRAARPVAGQPVGDPHWPVHVTLANMTRGADGRWSTVAGRSSTVAADERDLMRPAPAVDKLTQALVRNALHRRYGVR